MPRKSKSNQLPEWLWFFIALPVSLITVLLLRRQGKLNLPLKPVRGISRYSEPDSIPLDMEDRRAAPPVEELPPDEAEAVADMTSEGAPVAPEESFDDLKVIEGIGPSIAGLLRENGIQNFRQLAETPVERLTQILTGARLNHLADPTTWGEQARLAADGEWDALEAFQQTLKGGRKAK